MILGAFRFVPLRFAVDPLGYGGTFGNWDEGGRKALRHKGTEALRGCGGCGGCGHGFPSH